MPLRSLLALCVCVLVAAPGARAQQQQQRTPPRTLHVDWLLDGAVTTSASALWLGGEALKGPLHLAPSTCAWCGVNAGDALARDVLRWQDVDAADGASNVTGFVLVPLSTLGLLSAASLDAGAPGLFAEDTLMVGESVALAGLLNEAVKLGVARERPFVHALPSSQKAATAHASDNNVSFYSGHTSLAFSLAASAGTVASLRGYRLAPLVWGVGLASASLTGYLRIAADRHYLSDVVVGAAAGTAIGVLVPLLLHAAGTTSASPNATTAANRAPAAVVSFAVLL